MFHRVSYIYFLIMAEPGPAAPLVLAIYDHSSLQLSCLGGHGLSYAIEHHQQETPSSPSSPQEMTPQQCSSKSLRPTNCAAIVFVVTAAGNHRSMLTRFHPHRGAPQRAGHISTTDLLSHVPQRLKWNVCPRYQKSSRCPPPPPLVSSSSISLVCAFLSAPLLFPIGQFYGAAVIALPPHAMHTTVIDPPLLPCFFVLFFFSSFVPR